MLVTGATPLLRAAKTFDTDAMKLLIAHGARLDLPNASGIAPMHAAAGYGSLECDIRGYGPGIPQYMTADVQQRSIAALQVLLDAGADPERRDDRRRARQSPGSDAAVRRRVLGLERRRAVSRDARREGRRGGRRQDARAVDAALGRAGGHERGSSIKVFEQTAELLRSLCRDQPGCNPLQAGN